MATAAMATATLTTRIAKIAAIRYMGGKKCIDG